MAQNDENSPILIRGANGIPVGVISPSSKGGGSLRRFPRSTAGPDGGHGSTGLHSLQQQSRVPSSVLKATAVRKTATTKKKRTEARDGRSKQQLRVELTAEEADAVWRPLGAAFLGGEGALVGGDVSSFSIQNQTPLLQPPRMSEEVRPVNLQGLFDDPSVNDFSTVHVYVRVRPDGVGRGEGGGVSAITVSVRGVLGAAGGDGAAGVVCAQERGLSSRAGDGVQPGVRTSDVSG